MAKVTVPFRDRVTWRAYAAGDEWEGPAEREAELGAAGYVAVCATPAPEAADLSALTNPQLKALAEARGLDVPKRATKAQLLSLLEG